MGGTVKKRIIEASFDSLSVAAEVFHLELDNLKFHN